MLRAADFSRLAVQPFFDDSRHTQEECEEIAGEIGAATGIADRLLLYSTREYKKTRVRYFVEESEEEWADAPAADFAVAGVE